MCWWTGLNINLKVYEKILFLLVIIFYKTEMNNEGEALTQNRLGFEKLNIALGVLYKEWYLSLIHI